ncbi:MAG: hypothetical protein JO072_13190 [Parafilimonas sp.]|nr:hypothetical protein [Parafilimonas sp.]
MSRNLFATQFMVGEALSLLSRLEMVKPFALSMPMVVAANIPDEALKGITDLIVSGNKELKKRVRDFVNWVKHSSSHNVSAEEVQSRFALLKLRFNDLLDELDIFADVTSQRAEHDTGVWVAGLDALAADALNLKGNYYKPPPVICFLERGHGAAIRRARTRLPSGADNPVAVIQVPRERMVGSGIASSLIHEVGHQGIALLDLIKSLRNEIRHKQRKSNYPGAWELYYRWISEILADFWAMAHLGIGATLGLINVVSLPRYFMFRIKLDDPHPFPWIRVKLSLAFGRAIYPHIQWQRYERLWSSMYPLNKVDKKTLMIINALVKTMPEFVKTVINHSPPILNGKTLVDIFPYTTRQPAHLQFLYNTWRFAPDVISSAAPSLVFAVIGQAHADANISAPTESKLLSTWLTRWAFLNAENRTKNESRVIIHEIKNLIND